jgi:hypothetical protein
VEVLIKLISLKFGEDSISPFVAYTPVEAQDMNLLLVNSTVTSMETKQLQIDVLLNILLQTVNNCAVKLCH